MAGQVDTQAKPVVTRLNEDFCACIHYLIRVVTAANTRHSATVMAEHVGCVTLHHSSSAPAGNYA